MVTVARNSSSSDWLGEYNQLLQEGINLKVNPFKCDQSEEERRRSLTRPSMNGLTKLIWAVQPSVEGKSQLRVTKLCEIGHLCKAMFPQVVTM